VKERLVICNEEDTDGRARVTRDEERVLPIINFNYFLKKTFIENFIKNFEKHLKPQKQINMSRYYYESGWAQCTRCRAVQSIT